MNFVWSVVALECCVSFCCKQSGSAIQISIFPLFFISFPFRSHFLPTEIQEVLISYLFYTCCAVLCPWGFSRQEYWSWLPCPPPGDLPNPRREAKPTTLQADSLPSEPPGKPTLFYTCQCVYVSPNFPIHPTLLSPLVSVHLFSMSVSSFLLCK